MTLNVDAVLEVGSRNFDIAESLIHRLTLPLFLAGDCLFCVLLLLSLCTLVFRLRTDKRDRTTFWMMIFDDFWFSLYSRANAAVAPSTFLTLDVWLITDGIRERARAKAREGERKSVQQSARADG